jgi:quinol monooxygenase YgiN
MTTQYHQVIAHYYVSEGSLDRVLPLLDELTAASRAEPANLGYDYFCGREDPNHIVILERYTDVDGFAAHRASEHFQRIGVGQIIPLLDNRVIEEYAGTTGA